MMVNNPFIGADGNTVYFEIPITKEYLESGLAEYNSPEFPEGEDLCITMDFTPESAVALCQRLLVAIEEAQLNEPADLDGDSDV